MKPYAGSGRKVFHVILFKGMSGVSVGKVGIERLRVRIAAEGCGIRRSQGYIFCEGVWKCWVALFSSIFVQTTLTLCLFDHFRSLPSKLRSMYNALSADPNSLSNLDQDLPNYAQKEVSHVHRRACSCYTLDRVKY